MKSAVFRLVLITISTLLFLGMSLLILNMMAQQQKFSPLDHVLFAENSKYILASQPTLESFELSAFDHFDYKVTLLHVTSVDNEWVLKNNKEPAISLRRYLESSPVGNLALFVNSRINLGGLVKDLYEKGFKEKVIILANEQKILIELKKMAPRWLYAANPSQKMRLKIMDALWLSPVANYDFDFYIYDPSIENTPSPSVTREIQRRHKKILHKEKSLSKSLQIKFDGLWIE